MKSESQVILNYERIAKAIEYIQNNFKEQSDLNKIAKKIHLSSYHFQKLFTDWAGISPKKYIQFLSLKYAKSLLKERTHTLFDVASKTGLSGTSRLHDLFINIEGMTPGEYKNGGENLHINYSFAASNFGELFLASTNKGICMVLFTECREVALMRLKNEFPNAKLVEFQDKTQQNVLVFFQKDWSNLQQIKLHLKGTDFQLKVWQTLLKIPEGSLNTYGKIAQSINKPKASRAVGTAIGNNPVAFLIPCHRVIQSNGNIGAYMWGSTRKCAIIAWEAAQINKELI